MSTPAPDDRPARPRAPRGDEPPATYWVAGEVVDGKPPTTGAWSRIVAVLVLLGVVDLVLGLGRPTPAVVTPTARGDLDRVLAAAADEPGRSLLLIGDSVLAGDVMAPHLDGWADQRVVDYMRRELAVDAEVGVHQLALDGLLPVDLERLVAGLDRVDPGGRVEVVVELNLRYFSAAYADQRDCSRAWLCGLAPTVGAPPPDSALAPLTRLWQQLASDAAWIDDRLHALAPVHRRLAEREDPFRLDRVDGLVVADAPEGARSSAAAGEGEARVLEHYRSARIAAEHQQVAALRRTLARLHARGRPALLFVTPLEDQFAEQAAPAPELGGLHAELAGMVHELGDPRVRFVDLDHPVFVADLFIDHCHLWPDGNRLLARNLLHELSVPQRSRPPEAEMVTAEDVDQTLVARVDHGYAEGAAWQALFDEPDGIDVAPDGGWIVVADTHNHMLRQLRGDMRVVEPLAGWAGEPGDADGAARGRARLDRPRHPTIAGDAVVFVDGRSRDRLRALAGGQVRTLTWDGPRCDAYRRLRARDGWLYMLCDDGRVLDVPLADDQALGARPLGTSHELLGRPGAAAAAGTTPEPGRAHRFEVAPGGRLLFSDPGQRLWEATIAADGARLTERPRLRFANTSSVLLPSELKVTFPFGFDEIGLADVADLRWVDRYDALLVADEHPLAPSKPDPRLERELTERVHLRLFDLDTEQVYPWIKAIPHGEAYGLWNEKTNSTVSYYHRGSFAVAQADASVVWVERSRSRLFRMADGLLGLIKLGNRNSKHARVHLYDAFGNVAPDEALATYAPQRFFAARHDPFEREGPYLGVMVGSSLTTLVDRVGNYSLGRRVELELQRELGYRDAIRFDLFQRTAPSASFKGEVGMVDQLIDAGVDLDVIFVEVNDHGGRFFRGTETDAQLFAQLSRLERLAARTDALVVLFDNSALDADGRDGLRASSPRVHELLAAARKLGFLVIEPSDRMLRDLLVESPWGTQPWGPQGHHGAFYAIDRTAEVLTTLVYPAVRAHLRGRVPAQRAPIQAAAGKRGKPLAAAFEAGPIDPAGLPPVRAAYLQQAYEAGHVKIFVDLAGFDGAGELDPIAAAVLIHALDGEAYGQLADEVTITLVSFDNYDEYGEGVLESATTRWEQTFDAKSLAAFLAEASR